MSAGSGQPQRPAVSVCIPSYNYARFIGRAVASVLEQTFEDFELVVSDDASTDETRAVLGTFSDSRIRLEFNERNLGLFGNFNRCLQLARADLVKVLCADDWLHPQALADGARILQKHRHVSLVTSAGYLVDVKGETFGLSTAGFGRREVVPAQQALRVQADWLNVIGMPSNVLLRRTAALEAGGFDPRFAPASDLHLWLKLLCRSDLGWIAAPRCYLRIHTTKGHAYGDDPSESTFLSWQDVAAAPGSPITPALLDRARYAEAERSMMYVAAHLAQGRIARARRILKFTGKHVNWRQVLPRLVLRLPGLLWGQASRGLALSTHRLVVYSPAPRLGPPIDSIRQD